jgi:hypothetical protein
MRTAATLGGSFRLVTHDGVDWKADFVPKQGRAESLAFRKPLEACVAACERAHVLRHTNKLFAAAGDERLNLSELEGDALAWKRPRRF